MKRAGEAQEGGGGGGGPPAGSAKRGRGGAGRGGPFAFKVLCPEPLVASVVGSSGAVVARIQEDTGAHLTFSRRSEYYPESRLRLLVISGGDPSELLAALEQVIEQVVLCGDEERQVLEGAGTLEDDDGDFVDSSGEYRLRCVLTESAANAAIGPGGHGLSALSEETGARILVDSEVYDSHQLTTVGGSKQQMLGAFDRLSSLVQADVEEPWFAPWADQLRFSQPGSVGSAGSADPSPSGRDGGGPRRDGGGRAGHQRGTTIFVGGLPQSTEGGALRRHFERYGRVVETDVKMDPRTGRSKGFGFVTFAEASMVEKCFENTEEHVIDGKWVDVKHYGDPGDANSSAGEEAHGARRNRRGSSDDQAVRDARHGVQDDHPQGRGGAGGRWGGNGSQRWEQPPVRGPAEGCTIPRFVKLAKTVPSEYLGLDYCITCSLPSAQCGPLIGRRGENIMEVERKTGAKVQLSKKDPASDHRQLSIIGSIMSVYAAHLLLMRDFNDATAKREEPPPVDQFDGSAAVQKIEDLQRQIDMLKSQMPKRR